MSLKSIRSKLTGGCDCGDEHALEALVSYSGSNEEAYKNELKEKIEATTKRIINAGKLSTLDDLEELHRKLDGIDGSSFNEKVLGEIRGAVNKHFDGVIKSTEGGEVVKEMADLAESIVEGSYENLIHVMGDLNTVIHNLEVLKDALMRIEESIMEKAKPHIAAELREVSRLTLDELERQLKLLRGLLRNVLEGSKLTVDDLKNLKFDSSLIEKFEASPYGDTIRMIIKNLGTSAVVLESVKDALSKVGMKLSEYKDTDLPKFHKFIIEHADKGDDLYEYLNAAQQLYLNFHKRGEIAELIAKKSKSGGDVELVDPLTSIDKRVLAKRQLKLLVFRTFHREVLQLLEKLTYLLDKAALQVPKNVRPDTTLLDFVDALRRFDNSLGEQRLRDFSSYRALVGYYRDAASVAVKQGVMRSINDLKSAAMAVKEANKSAQPFNEIILTLDQILRVIDKYSDEMKMKLGSNEEAEVVNEVDDMEIELWQAAKEGAGVFATLSKYAGKIGDIVRSALGYTGENEEKDDLSSEDIQNGAVWEAFATQQKPKLTTGGKQKRKTKMGRRGKKKKGGDPTDYLSLGNLTPLIRPFKSYTPKVKISDAIKRFDYGVRISSALSSISGKAKERAQFADNYPAKVKAAAEDHKEKFSNVYTVLLSQLDRLTEDKELSKYVSTDEDFDTKEKVRAQITAAKQFLVKQQDARLQFWDALVALEEYMRLFTDSIAKQPQVIEELISMLENTDIIGQWYGNKSGDKLTQIFENFPNAHSRDSNKAIKPLKFSEYTLSKQKHYYELLAAEDKLPGNPYIPLDPKRAIDNLKLVNTALESIMVIKNLLSCFSKIGPKVDAPLTPAAIYNRFMNYMKYCTFTFGFDIGQLSGIEDLHDLPSDYSVLYDTDMKIATGANSELILSLSGLDIGYGVEALVAGKTRPTSKYIPTFSPKDVKIADITKDILVAEKVIAPSRASVVPPTANDYSNIFRKQWGVWMRSVNSTIKKYEPLDFSLEDQFFVMAIKSIAAKIFTISGTYNLFKRPHEFNGITPVRLMLGGSEYPTINPDAIELYLRLTLLAQFYKNLFEYKDDQYDRYPELRRNDVNIKISMIPDIEGMFAGLIRIVFRTAYYSNNDNFSDETIRELIAEINEIYKQGKQKYGDDVLMGVVNEFVKEINRRYGIISKESKQAYEREMGGVYDYGSQVAMRGDLPKPWSFDEPSPNYAILEGESDTNFEEGEVEQINSIVLREKLRQTARKKRHNVTLDHMKILHKFRCRVDELFDNADEGFSFRKAIELAKKKVALATKAEDKYKEIVNLIRCTNITDMSDHSKYLVFHETVVSGLNLLSAIHSLLAKFKLGVSAMDFADLRKVYYDKHPSSGVSKPEELKLNAKMAREALELKGLLEKDEENTFVESILNAIKSGAGASADFTHADVSVDLIMRKLLDLVYGFNDFQGLVKIDIHEGKFSADFSGLIKRVKSLFIDIGGFLEMLAPTMDKATVAPYLDKLTPGSYYWLQEQLLEKIIEGREADADNKYVAYENLGKLTEKLSRVFKMLTEERAPSAGAAKAKPNYNDLFHELTVGRALSEKATIAKFAEHPMDELLFRGEGKDRMADTRFLGRFASYYSWDNDFTDKRGDLFMLNQLVAKMLSTFYDASTKKIYKRFVDGLGTIFNGAMVDIMQTYPDIAPMVLIQNDGTYRQEIPTEDKYMKAVEDVVHKYAMAHNNFPGMAKINISNLFRTIDSVELSLRALLTDILNKASLTADERAKQFKSDNLPNLLASVPNLLKKSDGNPSLLADLLNDDTITNAAIEQAFINYPFANDAIGRDLNSDKLSRSKLLIYMIIYIGASIWTQHLAVHRTSATLPSLGKDKADDYAKNAVKELQALLNMHPPVTRSMRIHNRISWDDALEVYSNQAYEEGFHLPYTKGQYLIFARTDDGSLDPDQMQEKLAFDGMNPADLNYKDANWFINRTGNPAIPSSKHILFTSIAAILRNMKANATSHISSVNEIESYMKDKLRAYLPVYKNLFKDLAMRTRLESKLLKAVDVTLPSPSVRPDIYPLNLPAHNTEGKFAYSDLLTRIEAAALDLAKLCDTVFVELGDRIEYMESQSGSSQSYRDINGFEPLAPLSSSLLILQNRSDIRESVFTPSHTLGDDEFKYAFGTRQVLGQLSGVKPREVEGFYNIVEHHNSVAKKHLKLDNASIGRYEESFLSLLKFVHQARNVKGILNEDFFATLDMVADKMQANSFMPRVKAAVKDLHPYDTNTDVQLTNRSDISLTNNAFIKGNNLSLQFKYAHPVYSINNSLAAVVRLTDSIDKNARVKDLISDLLPVATAPKNTFEVQNIIDLNIVPIDPHALMREDLSFLHLYNYSYTFDRMLIDMFYGVRNSDAKRMIKSMCGGDISSDIRTPKDMLVALLVNPFMELFVDRDGDNDELTVRPVKNLYEDFVKGMLRGEVADDGLARPRFLSDEILNKLLLDEMYSGQYLHNRMGPAVAEITEQRLTEDDIVDWILGNISIPPHLRREELINDARKLVRNPLMPALEKDAVKHAYQNVLFNIRILSLLFALKTVKKDKLHEDIKKYFDLGTPFTRPSDTATILADLQKELTPEQHDLIKGLYDNLSSSSKPMKIAVPLTVPYTKAEKSTLTYINKAAKNTHYSDDYRDYDDMQINEVKLQGKVKDARELSGRMRFDTVMIRMLVFVINMYRVMRLKLQQDLKYNKDVIQNSISVVDPNLTEFWRNSIEGRELSGMYKRNSK